MLGDMLEFFDYYLIGFALPFFVGPWNLTFGQSAIILLTSGVGAMFGAVLYGRLADVIGRRRVFMATVLNAAFATGMLALTPEGNWIYIAVFRFVAGVGVGGLYSVDLPLVQEFVPASKRGMVSGLVTSTIPLGLVLASILAATVTPYVGWRGLFAIGMAPALLTFVIRFWVPESPRWLLRMGRPEEARRALAVALEMDPDDLPPAPTNLAGPVPPWSAIFRHPRSLVVSWLANLGSQTGSYGLKLWSPTLIALVLSVTPQRAAFLMIWISLAGFGGRIIFSYLSDRIGRRPSAIIYGFGASSLLITAALNHDVFLGSISVFWLLLIAAEIFVDGGWAITGPYSAEIWPATMRTTGMGSAYGFGGFGKVIGPLGLALIVGSDNVVTPKASIDALLPSYVFLGCAFLLVGAVFFFLAKETRGRPLEALEMELLP